MILSSIIGYVLVQIPWESHVVFTKFFDRLHGRAYWRHQLKFALLALIPCAVTLAAVYVIPIDKTRGLIVKGAAAAAVSALAMLAIFGRELAEVLKKLRKRS